MCVRPLRTYDSNDGYDPVCRVVFYAIQEVRVNRSRIIFGQMNYQDKVVSKIALD